MFLKSLNLFGFKSFADHTHIDFADGITALLGPNGCGKSNVVDAIKWVLAENRSKNLRADKMEDVIFNGTEKRPALNVAEVILTIDNSQKLLPLDEEEIELKRRLFRSGENEYFINGRLVGPGEVRKLFMDTGIGKSAYSVMEQGKIDQILSSKPEDRRYLFEEAAGISRSKAECQAAERELEKTRINLQQIEIALNEIKHSYDSLKVQAEKTEKYRALKEAIFSDEIDLQLLRLKKGLADKENLDKELKETDTKRTEVKDSIDKINKILSENMDKVQDMQEKFHKLQSELIGVGAEKNGKTALAKQLTDQISIVKGKIGQIEIKKKALEERIDNLTEEIDEQDAELHDKSKRLEDLIRNIESFRNNINTSSSQIEANKKQIENGITKIEILAEKQKELQKDLESITENIVQDMDSKLKNSGYSSASRNIAKQNLEDIVAKLKIYANGRKTIFSDYAKNINKNISDTTLASILSDAETAFTEIDKQIKSLNEAIGIYEKTIPDFIDDFLSPEGIITKKRNVDEAIKLNRKSADEIRFENESLDKENATLSLKINEYKDTLSKLQINQAQLETQKDSLKSQINILKRNLTSEENSKRELDEELYAETKQQEELQEKIEENEEELAEIEARGKKIAEDLDNLDKDISSYNDNVSGKKDELKQKLELQAELQSKYEKISMNLAMNESTIHNIKQNFLDTHSRDLTEFIDRIDKITLSSAVLKENLLKNKESIRTLGEVNLMAVDEFREVKDRYERQKTSYDDTKEAVENLERVAKEIKTKSAEIFVETYNKIRKNFHNMFRRLFNGGRGELRLVNPEDVLSTGIDIYAQPPGKKLENIALLSGGEKTMTAVALLFATYQVRPSPFCLLDEIDAALDDKNVLSFVQALRSFSTMSQYIVITHNKKTVMGARTMLGVTMEESGISKIIALRLDEDIKKDDTDSIEQDNFVDEDIPEEKGIVIPPRPPKRNI